MYSFLFPFTCTPSLSHLPYTPLPSHYLNPYGPPTPTLQYISHFFLSRIPYEYVCIVHMHSEYLYCISKACSPIKQNNCLTVSLSYYHYCTPPLSPLQKVIFRGSRNTISPGWGELLLTPGDFNASSTTLCVCVWGGGDLGWVPEGGGGGGRWV